MRKNYLPNKRPFIKAFINKHVYLLISGNKSESFIYEFDEINNTMNKTLITTLTSLFIGIGSIVYSQNHVPVSELPKNPEVVTFDYNLDGNTNETKTTKYKGNFKITKREIDVNDDNCINIVSIQKYDMKKGRIVNEETTLSNYPVLKEHLKTDNKNIHSKETINGTNFAYKTGDGSYIAFTAHTNLF